MRLSLDLCPITSKFISPVKDIIFLRGWYPILPRKYYNPVTSLLVEGGDWQGMRLTGQVRREQAVKTPLNINSAYRVRSLLHVLGFPLLCSLMITTALQ